MFSAGDFTPCLSVFSLPSEGDLPYNCRAFFSYVSAICCIRMQIKPGSCMFPPPSL